MNVQSGYGHRKTAHPGVHRNVALRFWANSKRMQRHRTRVCNLALSVIPKTLWRVTGSIKLNVEKLSVNFVKFSMNHIHSLTPMFSNLTNDVI